MRIRIGMLTVTAALTFCISTTTAGEIHQAITGNNLKKVKSLLAANPKLTPPAPVRPLEPIPSAPPLEVARIGDRVQVPDFRGYTLSEVRQITAAHALDLQAFGSGRAISQRPAAGTVLAGRERRVHVRFGQGHAQVRSEPRGRQG